VLPEGDLLQELLNHLCKLLQDGKLSSASFGQQVKVSFGLGNMPIKSGLPVCKSCGKEGALSSESGGGLVGEGVPVGVLVAFMF